MLVEDDGPDSLKTAAEVAPLMVTFPALVACAPPDGSVSTQISGQRFTLPLVVPEKELLAKSSPIVWVPVAVPLGNEICAHEFRGLADVQLFEVVETVG